MNKALHNVSYDRAFMPYTFSTVQISNDFRFCVSVSMYLTTLNVEAH